jgi:hypothetical protein
MDTGKIDLSKSSYIQDKLVVPGVGGTEVFQYITKDNTEGGATELRMTYAKIGLQDTIQIDSFKVNLKIEEMMPD